MNRIHKWLENVIYVLYLLLYVGNVKFGDNC
jgi:hypothetical protein